MECKSTRISGEDSTGYAYLTSDDDRKRWQTLFTHPDTTSNFCIYINRLENKHGAKATVCQFSSKWMKEGK